MDGEARFETFTVLITKIRRSIQRIKSEEMSEYNLKSPHVSCIYCLYKRGPMTATQLCEFCDEDKAAISRSLVQLEEKGFVSCSSGNKKRYRAVLELTEEGRAVASGIAQKIDRVLKDAGIGISEEERIIMYKNLTMISENLEKVCLKYDK